MKPKAKKEYEGTTNNLVYNRAKLRQRHVDCMVCMGPCGGYWWYQRNRSWKKYRKKQYR